MSFTRSATGCLACKIKHKKCDETKPYCLRCQKARIECPGYTFIQDPDKPSRKRRTIPAPRTVAGRSRVSTHQEAWSTNTEEHRLQFQNQLPSYPDLVAPDVEHSPPSTSTLANAGTQFKAPSISDPWVPSTSFDGSFRYSSTGYDARRSVINPHLIAPRSSTSTATAMASGQTSLFTALFHLGPSRDLCLPPQSAQHIANSPSGPDIPLATYWSPPNRGREDDDTAHHDQDPEAVVSVIRRELVLDKTAESNALPFVLQSYVTWIGRVAFDPQKLMHTSRNFVCSHFGVGEQSRWIIALLANVGSKIGSVEVMETKPIRMLSLLRAAVRQQLATVKSRQKPERVELVRVLNSTLETMIMHFHISPVGDIMALIQEVTPIFRQLCPEPPGEPVNLPSLLQHPLDCLRRYAQLDISFSLLSDMPTMFRYEFAAAGSQPVNPYRSASPSQSDGVLQWLHGIPNSMIILLAKMKGIRQAGIIPNEEMVALLERDIRDSEPYDGSSSEPFLAIMRFVVHECWRQAAFIYLYMAVCGDPSDTPRVKEAFKRYMGLLNGTEPGRLPDEHLLPILPLISPAALRKRDRQVIRQRVLGLYSRDQTDVANTWIIFVIDGVWARVEAEGRPTVWSDFVAPQKRVVNA